MLSRAFSRRECPFSDVAEIDQAQLTSYTSRVKRNVLQFVTPRGISAASERGIPRDAG